MSISSNEEKRYFHRTSHFQVPSLFDANKNITLPAGEKKISMLVSFNQIHFMY